MGAGGLVIAGAGGLIVANGAWPNTSGGKLLWDPNFGSDSASNSGFPLGNGYVLTWAELVQIVFGLILIVVGIGML